MSEPEGPEAERAADEVGEEREVSRLLVAAGPRDEVPAEDLAQIKAAFRAAWQLQVGERTRPPAPARRARLPRSLLALAATLALVLGAAWWLSRGPVVPAPSVVARVESLRGGLATSAARGASHFGVGSEIPAGAWLETSVDGAEGPGVAALRLSSGTSLRLDGATRVCLETANRVRLERGAVYLDSGGLDHRAGVVVVTPLGEVREVGTQFEVRLLAGEGGTGESEMRVRVREGEVRLEAGGGSRSATAGQELTLRSDGSVARGSVIGHGTPWDWVLAAAPPLASEGRTLGQLLEAVARETGWRIDFADEGLAASARSIVVHGDLGPLRPDQVPDVVLAGAGLRGEVVDGALVISRIDAPSSP
ncbi:MAG TPA: FecR domain-containing protein [Thermoanaerobaculia bacterium]|nr:FecR domain-containing protein [Thermoanaerobaculia bacterium]